MRYSTYCVIRTCQWRCTTWSQLSPVFSMRCLGVRYRGYVTADRCLGIHLIFHSSYVLDQRVPCYRRKSTESLGNQNIPTSWSVATSSGSWDTLRLIKRLDFRSWKQPYLWGHGSERPDRCGENKRICLLCVGSTNVHVLDISRDKADMFIGDHVGAFNSRFSHTQH